MKIVFEQIRIGGDRNFGYLLGDRDAGAAVAVDPAFSPDVFVERARNQGLKIETIINTHGHLDHTNGNARLKELTGAPIAAHPKASPKPEVALDDGASLTVGSIGIDVLFVPGHAPDHILLHLPAQRIAITGDLLFVGKIGGTATEEQARTEYESLQRVLEALPDDTTIWPGHDFGARPSSTIALEKASNPFLQTEDFAAFLELKRTWAEFKARHGLR